MNSLTIRIWHSYIGIFIAPSILFFSLTGAMQLFSLHEDHGSYEAPAILEKLGTLHKDQVLEARHAPEAPEPPPSATVPAAATPEAAPAAAKHAHPEHAKSLPTMLLKWFFLIVALCLASSTLFGLWMGLAVSRRKRTAYALLLAGIVIPGALLLAL